MTTEDLELDDDFLNRTEVEEVPDIPPAPKKPAGRKRAAYPRGVPKEFDIRAAHAAWKEKNGIDDEYPW